MASLELGAARGRTMSNEDHLRAVSQRFVEEEELSYQSISLPGGVITPGTDRAYLLDTIFQSPFEGKSFLDVGSYLGYFCIEALRRGAIRACGIETDASHVR